MQKLQFHPYERCAIELQRCRKKSRARAGIHSSAKIQFEHFPRRHPGRIPDFCQGRGRGREA